MEDLIVPFRSSLASDLRDDRVEHLPLEGPEDDGLVLDRVDDEALAGLDQAGPDVVDRRHRDHEAVLARAEGRRKRIKLGTSHKNGMFSTVCVLILCILP